MQTIDGFNYHVIFVNHYTKYIWFNPIKNKFDIFPLFSTFKKLIEIYFWTSIISIYLDGGSEFQWLFFFSSHDITHIQTPPHTPQHNDSAKHHHRHIVETELTLLHQVFLFSSFWSYTFQIAIYLINHLPIRVLNFKSPFEALYTIHRSHTKLCAFGCLCYP